MTMSASFAVPANPSHAAPPPQAKAAARATEETERIKQICEMNGLQVLKNATAQCTHGEDPPPPGMDIRKDVKPVATLSAAEAGALGTTGLEVAPGAPSFVCDGDGVGGYRTQVMYVRATGTADRYSTYKASFLQWVSETDHIYRSSAQDTGGNRRIRFVHDSSCTPTILNLTVSPSGDDDMTNTINELQAAGYNRSDRKYLIFMDAKVLCGVGTMMVDDRPGQENWNNFGPDYARIDSGCWSGHIAAHEHMHMMGGVQNTAPHASGGNHCTDEYDIMCYSDSPNYPKMQILCSTTSRDRSHFDCNYDDYYNTNPPPGSYLANRWNTANNRFLVSDGGTAMPPACPDQALEPDETHAGAAQLVMGVSKQRALCTAGDQDWMSFQASANQRYALNIVSRASGITPSLEVFAGNGKRLLASHFPSVGGLAAVEFRARTGGTHYVRTKNLTSSYTASPSNLYELRVSPAAPAGTSIGGFGYNAYNQIGGTPSEINTIPGISFNASSVQTSAGYLHSAAVMSDGTVRTWGWNGYGQLGNGSRVDSAQLVNPGLTGVVSVSAGLLHTLALKSDGTVWAWGWNGTSTLGDGTSFDRLRPVRVLGLTDVVEVSAGWLHNLALKKDGTVWAWGFNDYGALGDGTTVSKSVPVKVTLPKATSVSAGGYHSLAALEDGRATGWGFNGHGQVGDGTRMQRTRPALVSGMSGVYRMSAGYAHSVLLKNDGSVWSWGYNVYQQTGGAPTEDRLYPAAIMCSNDPSCPKLAGPTMGKIVWLSAGSCFNNVALAEDGSVWSWGWNGTGQFGNGTTAGSGTAVRASGLKADDVAASCFHTLYRS